MSEESQEHDYEVMKYVRERKMDKEMGEVILKVIWKINKEAGKYNG